MPSDKAPYILAALLGVMASPGGTDEVSAREGQSLLELGSRTYQQHCASCHGPNGEGAAVWKTPNAQGELPPPPHGPEGHTWRHADAQLDRMIREGWRDPFNKTTRLTMPGFGDVLADQEIRAVIAHLKTLWTPEQRRFQARETRKRQYGAVTP